MNNEQFDELAGRIQALADLTCGLISELDKKGIIYIPGFAGNLSALAENRSAPGYQESARQTLKHLAKLLDDEHKSRQ